MLVLQYSSSYKTIITVQSSALVYVFPCYNYLWRLSTPVSPGFAMNLGLLCHSTCLVLLLGLGSVIYLTADLLIDQNIITTYPTISAWSTHICLVFLTFIGSPLWYSQISDHQFCLTTLLWTRQICYCNNFSANFQPLPSFHAQSGTSMFTLGFCTHLYSTIWTVANELFHKFVSAIPWFTRTGVQDHNSNTLIYYSYC